MALDKSHYIHTEADGRLGETTPADLDALVQGLADKDHVVLHFHGGLINEATGRRIAERLVTVYEPALAVFFIWESGFLETIRHSLGEIINEAIFKHLLETISKWTVGKLQTEIGLKAGPGQLDLPNDIQHKVELRKAADPTEATEPYQGFEPLPADEVGEVTPDEEEAFRAELEEDPDFVREVEAILQGLEFEGSDEFKAARPNVEAAPTLMSPEIVEELTAEAPAPGERGILSAAKLALMAARVFGRVVHRFVTGRDHGVYVTTVEETLRALYVANIGAGVWSAMKKETEDTFQTVPGQSRGGNLFLVRLGELCAQGHGPKRITLVGHSTGAVFINNLLAATDAARHDPTHPLPEQFRFGDVVFLAPACSFRQFGEVLEDHRSVFDEFRMFSMDDDHEVDDTLVPVIYPRSLLYFVSGVVEQKPDGKGAADLPVVGMQRFHLRRDQKDPFAALPGVTTVRSFVAADKRRAVWSVTEPGAPPGFQGDSITHAGFDDTDPGEPHAAMNSVKHLISHGWAG